MSSLKIKSAQVEDSMGQISKSGIIVLAPQNRDQAPPAEWVYEGDLPHQSSTPVRPSGHKIKILTEYGGVPSHTLVEGLVDYIDGNTNSDTDTVRIEFMDQPQNRPHLTRMTVLYTSLSPRRELSGAKFGTWTAHSILKDVCAKAGLEVGRIDLPDYPIVGTFQVSHNNPVEVANRLCNSFNLFPHTQFRTKIDRNGLQIIKFDYRNPGISNPYRLPRIISVDRHLEAYIPDQRIGTNPVLLQGATVNRNLGDEASDYMVQYLNVKARSPFEIDLQKINDVLADLEAQEKHLRGMYDLQLRRESLVNSMRQTLCTVMQELQVQETVSNSNNSDNLYPGGDPSDGTKSIIEASFTSNVGLTGFDYTLDELIMLFYNLSLTELEVEDREQDIEDQEAYERERRRKFNERMREIRRKRAEVALGLRDEYDDSTEEDGWIPQYFLNPLDTGEREACRDRWEQLVDLKDTCLRIEDVSSILAGGVDISGAGLMVLPPVRIDPDTGKETVKFGPVSYVQSMQLLNQRPTEIKTESTEWFSNGNRTFKSWSATYFEYAIIEKGYTRRLVSTRERNENFEEVKGVRDPVSAYERRIAYNPKTSEPLYSVTTHYFGVRGQWKYDHRTYETSFPTASSDFFDQVNIQLEQLKVQVEQRSLSRQMVRQLKRRAKDLKKLRKSFENGLDDLEQAKIDALLEKDLILLREQRDPAYREPETYNPSSSLSYGNGATITRQGRVGDSIFFPGASGFGPDGNALYPVQDYKLLEGNPLHEDNFYANVNVLGHSQSPTTIKLNGEDYIQYNGPSLPTLLEYGGLNLNKPGFNSIVAGRPNLFSIVYKASNTSFTIGCPNMDYTGLGKVWNQIILPQKELERKQCYFEVVKVTMVYDPTAQVGSSVLADGSTGLAESVVHTLTDDEGITTVTIRRIVVLS